jgi:hypothetical protein
MAICAAVTEPWPVGVDAGPFMSESTPILTTLSEISAPAGPVHDSTAKAASAAGVNCLDDNYSSPDLRPIAVLFARLLAGVFFV